MKNSWSAWPNEIVVNRIEIGMKIVGDHLTGVAANRADVSECDLFGRSAFNRYYYAAYLITRDMLTQLDPAWGKTSHGGIPDLLEDSVINKIRKEARIQEKAGILSKTGASNIRTAAASAVAQLAYDVTERGCPHPQHFRQT